MRTLAFSSTPNKLSWLILEGSYHSPKLASPKLERIKLPPDVEDGSGLCSLIQTLSLLIDTQKPEHIAVLQAGKSKFNNASPIRAKLEAVLQIAAAQKAIPLDLVSPLTVSAYKKKLEKTESSIEAILNGGQAFSPAEMGEVICAGVVKLPRE